LVSGQFADEAERLGICGPQIKASSALLFAANHRDRTVKADILKS
jgi:hypothetical protein